MDKGLINELIDSINSLNGSLPGAADFHAHLGSIAYSLDRVVAALERQTSAVEANTYAVNSLESTIANAR